MKVLLTALVFTLALSSQLRAQDPAPAATTAPAIVGEWDVTTVSPQGETTNLMVVSRDGEALKAVAKSEAGELPYDSIALTGNTVTFVLTIDFQGSPMIITYTGGLDGKTMSGDCDFGGLAQGTWSAAHR
jgi:hypothetical protein